MVEVSIICLIYKSKHLADMVYESLYKYTPMLKNGQAEFFFVANDPSNILLDHLKAKKYPFYLNYNKLLSEKELFKLGYGMPEYIRRVYQGYNFGILKAKGKRIVLINSDNFFSEDWLENLLKYSEYKNVVCSTLVEPGHKFHSIFPGAISADFGNSTKNYDDESFQQFSKQIKKTGLKIKGAYMPCLLYKEMAILAGLYPEGNIATINFETISEYGDESFYRRLNSFGVKHITSKDSIVYHLKEGEKDEEEGEEDKLAEPFAKENEFGKSFKSCMEIIPKDVTVNLKPTIQHTEIINKLLSKVSVLIYHFNDEDDLFKQIEIVKNQTYKNIEICICINNNKKLERVIQKKYPNVIINRNALLDSGTQIYNTILNMDGSFVLVLNGDILYYEDFIEKAIAKSNEISCPNNVVYADCKFISSNNFSSSNIATMLLHKNVILDNYIFWINLFLDQANNIDKGSTLNISFTNISNLFLEFSQENIIKNSYIKKLMYSIKTNGIRNTLIRICKKIFKK